MKKTIQLLTGTLCVLLLGSMTVLGQIHEPEGLNMPGAWDGTFRNPDAIPNVFQSAEQFSPDGELSKITSGTTRWQTTFNVAASGADAIGGTRAFLFTSGPEGSYYNNKWAGVNVTMNTVQTYTYNSGADNSITITNGNWYTVNWKDNGYQNTDAIFMETTAQPIELNSVTEGAATSTNFVVNITLSAAKSAEEKVYVRYSDDSFATSSHVEATGSGTSYSATIPATGDVTYYVLTTTVELGDDNTTYSGDYDMATIKLNNNSGNNYEYNYGFEVEISGNAGWRMLSFPKTGGTVADISDNTAIQGVTGGDNPGAASNFMTYDNDGSFQTPTNTSTAIGDGYGFITYFYDNTTAGSSELPITLDASGAEPSSQVSVTLNKSTLANEAYYTLVGNPFASNYDLNQITVTGGAISNNVQIWDDGASSYATQDRTTPFIASPWQGFWVEVASGNGATSIEFPTAGKSTSDTTATYFSKSNSQKADVHFELISENSFDKAIRLSFRENAEMGWDLDDASKFIPLLDTYATLGFVGEERLQSVFSLPYDLQENYEIKMQESLVGVSGEFTLSWEGMETLPEGITLKFNDYKTGESVDMSMASSYTFEAFETAGKRANPLTMLSTPVAEIQKAKSAEDGRFGITVSAKEATSNEPSENPEAFTLEQNYPNPFNPTTSIQYSVAEAGAVSLTIYNVMGQQVATLVNETKSAGTYRVSWDAANSASGIYYYRLQAGNTVLTRQMTLIK